LDALDAREVTDDCDRVGVGMGSSGETTLAGRGPGARSASILTASILAACILAADAAVARVSAGTTPAAMAAVVLAT